MKNAAFLLLVMLWHISAGGQTLGGNSIYNFLRLSNTPQLTALGGQNISNQSDDIGMAFHNPALLRPSMHTQASFVFNALYGGIRNYHMQLGYRSENLNTNFAFGINYFNYGSVAQTDAAGNVFGDFRPTDFVMQLSMSRNYLSKWIYGATAKFVSSDYGVYRSSGLALDLALSYQDTGRQLQASLVISNIGTQLKTYAGQKEELPFDIQLGVSKKLENAPIQFSITANRLHRFDVTYNDTAYNSENGLRNGSRKFSADNIFRHIVLSSQVYITDKIELSIGYNYLRRRELNAGSAGNGINGFSAGLGVLFRKIQLRYARAYYQSNRSYHQVGLNLRMNELAKLAKNTAY